MFVTLVKPVIQPAKKDLLKAAAPPHSRTDWRGPGCQAVLVHEKLSVMWGTEEGLRMPKAKVAALYKAAKTEFDMDAAFQVIDVCWRKACLEKLIAAVLLYGRKPIIVSPHPAFDDDEACDADAPFRPRPKNALPFALAAKLRASLDGIANDEIRQGARVGRTKLPNFPKFLFQPHFVGSVATDRPYILVDDNLGLGGTLASLHSHIANNGGTVIGITALSHTTGRDVPFALTESTLSSLHEKYGPGLGTLWKEKIGYEPNCLTEGEGRFLVTWDSGAEGPGFQPDERLLALRARLDRARATFR